jgi:hypothetical protein
VLRLVFAIALSICAFCPAAGFAEETYANTCAPAHVEYVSTGEFGHLTLFANPGLQFTAWDLAGQTVAFGTVMMPGQPVPIFGAAPGPLTVRIGSQILFADSTRDTIWE